MTEHDNDDPPLEPDSLDPVLDRGFAAAGNAAGRDDPADAPSVIQRLGEIIGKRPAVSLAETGSTADAPMLKPLAATDGIAPKTGKYMVQGMLGQGGVGAVHKGHDSDLGRDVALKFLHEKYRDQPDILQRFVEEAQIGGQLQHPGIVPVYELGMADGRPFFAMKMVKGKTLAQKLAERESVADDRRTFLSIYESICQTMAYAHARGVVHRDLKPANVMIGSFGEVQIVDWGMGKVIEHGGVADEKLAAERQVSQIETVRTGEHGTQSVMGSVMGTPAYMPPEQARGDVDAMDARSDVFALGAILCELLTGKPPYVGEQNELLRAAAMGQLDDAYARLRDCGAEPDLIALGTSCLMPAPAARPRSATAVAATIHGHLAAAEARSHEARVEAAEARGREASLRRVQKLGIALLVVIAVGLGASLWFWQEADDQRALAEQAALDATAAQTLAETNLANFNRLSHVVRLEAGKATASSLYPAWPDKSQAIRDWLDGDARALQAALPELRATLAALEERMRSAAAGTAETDSIATQAADADRFLRDTLTALVLDIETFASSEIAEVEQRLFWSERVTGLTITRHAAKWEAARRAILAADGVTASRLYAEQPIDLQPQLGLVPIGMNPRSKLWEFHHLRSAWDPSEQPDPAAIEDPVHDADGKVDVTAKGIVFVLIPGGTFFVGAQRTDPSRPNFDPSATKHEGPVHEVELAPYFLAKHELTQGQWARLTGGDRPSWYKVGVKYAGVPIPVGDGHPVDTVSWVMCDELLTSYGLVLPTEAQWEFGARAGTTTPWFTGADSASLEGFANVLDRTGERVPPEWSGGEAFDDGYKGPAPVGLFEPNAFGLHDVHGNYWEWCKDPYGSYELPVRAGDGARQSPTDAVDRVYRGGGFRFPGEGARVALRDRVAPLMRTSELGVRPARNITP